MDVNEEIWVSVCGAETRVVVVEQGDIREIQVQRGPQDTLVGNIYSAKVARVMPDLQAAFVDFGTERHGFLALADLASCQPKLKKDSLEKTATITDFLYQGQKLQVQVIKDAVASKGARLTTQISISSHYLALSAGSSGVGVSRNITEAAERSRLRQLVLDAGKLETQANGMEGFILRTAAQGASAEAIATDFRFLVGLWSAVSERSKLALGVTALYSELPLSLRVLRDLACSSTETIRVDCHDTFLTLESFCQNYMPELVGKLQYHDDGFPELHELAVEAEIDRALNSRVDLAGGGYLVIEQTEAMTVVDVNSGSSVGTNRDKAATFRINKEAAKTLARQLRLRNIGGIIVVDFIDMVASKQRRDLVSFLRQCTAADSAVGKISETSHLGLVEMTRKRSRQSLAQVLSQSCSQCWGRGQLKSPETICFDILRKLGRINGDNITVMASPEVVDHMVKEQSAQLDKLRARGRAKISFRTVTTGDPELFEVALF
ncbi:MAG: ribonuclease G [Halioglobus sp.]